MSEKADTHQKILDLAQQLVQERGFNGFSYTDISGPLGVKNASIHYHFPSKTDLGVALVRRYRQQLQQALPSLPVPDRTAPQLLDLYLTGYQRVVHTDGRICLCAMLAGDLNTLPEPIQAEVEVFFQVNQDWLTRVIDQGMQAGHLRVAGSAKQAAEGLLATLQGAMLVSRACRDMQRFGQIGRWAIETLVVH